jgi:hypothetical protein
MAMQPQKPDNADILFFKQRSRGFVTRAHTGYLQKEFAI